MIIPLAFRNRLSGDLYIVRQQFDQVVAAIIAGWKKQHKPDGSHADVTADSLLCDGTTRLGGPLYGHRDGVFTPPTIGGDQANYGAPYTDAWCLRLSASSTYNISGFRAPSGTHFRRLLLINIGAQNIALLHEDSGSTAGNRLSTPGAATVTLNAGDSVWMNYDTVSQRWRPEGL